MPDLFVLRVGKIQAGPCWPGEMGGTQVQKTLWSQEEASRISAFILMSESGERSARTLPCGQLMSVGEASSAPERVSELSDT